MLKGGVSAQSADSEPVRFAGEVERHCFSSKAAKSADAARHERPGTQTQEIPDFSIRENREDKTSTNKVEENPFHFSSMGGGGAPPGEGGGGGGGPDDSGGKDANGTNGKNAPGGKGPNADKKRGRDDKDDPNKQPRSGGKEKNWDRDDDKDGKPHPVDKDDKDPKK